MRRVVVVFVGVVQSCGPCAAAVLESSVGGCVSSLVDDFSRRNGWHVPLLMVRRFSRSSPFTTHSTVVCALPPSMQTPFSAESYLRATSAMAAVCFFVCIMFILPMTSYFIIWSCQPSVPLMWLILLGALLILLFDNKFHSSVQGFIETFLINQLF